MSSSASFFSADDQLKRVVERVRKEEQQHPDLYKELVRAGIHVGVRYGGGVVEIRCQTDDELDRARWFVAEFEKKYPKHPSVLQGIRIILWSAPPVFW